MSFHRFRKGFGVEKYNKAMDSAQRRGGLVSISPSQTPRSSDKAVREIRSGDSNSSSKIEKEKGVNVQVLVRCR